MKSNQVLIDDILDAVNAIYQFVEGVSFEEFENNEMMYEAVIRKLEIIGEASNKRDLEFREKHDKIPWRDIIDTRNRLIHDYTGIDLEQIWKILDTDLKNLKQFAEAISD